MQAPPYTVTLCLHNCCSGLQHPLKERLSIPHMSGVVNLRCPVFLETAILLPLLKVSVPFCPNQSFVVRSLFPLPLFTSCCIFQDKVFFKHIFVGRLRRWATVEGTDILPSADCRCPTGRSSQYL